jgi:hypothetical protein
MEFLTQEDIAELAKSSVRLSELDSLTEDDWSRYHAMRSSPNYLTNQFRGFNKVGASTKITREDVLRCLQENPLQSCAQLCAKLQVGSMAMNGFLTALRKRELIVSEGSGNKRFYRVVEND